ncbi:hypothetical protein AYI70_g2571 [Smittium culicis]|uniref:Uncharacterized protein n=1 Tax=Smittium culicis TaxID=133412 RepID=A0A1R1Y7S5_9FUNG|nr:hypothetical protein AYI70_g2571 [Smittium culicis]
MVTRISRVSQENNFNFGYEGGFLWKSAGNFDRLDIFNYLVQFGVIINAFNHESLRLTNGNDILEIFE